MQGLPKLTDDQQAIFDNFIDRVNNFRGRTEAVLIGPAGTGKTRLLTEIVKSLQNSYTVAAITSPTHKANSVIRNMLTQNGVSSEDIKLSTIHSFLGLKLVNEKNHQVLKLDNYNSKINNKVDVLIVDECSMVSKDLYMYIMNQIKRVRRAILFVGDSCQLPPVDTEGQKDETELSPTFGAAVKYELKQVLRQALDNPNIKVATDIRHCIGSKTNPMTILNSLENVSTIHPTYDEMEFLNSYRDYIKEGSTGMDDLYNLVQDNKILAYTNYRVNFANMYIRAELFGSNEEEFKLDEPVVFESITENCPYAVQEIIKCPKFVEESFMGVPCYRLSAYDGTSILCVGPYTRFALDKALEDLVRKIELKMKNPLTAKPYTWQDYYIIKNRINILNYPYATTVHKSQGSTFDNAWFDLDYVDRIKNNDIKSRIIYTALTRPRYNVILRKY